MVWKMDGLFDSVAGAWNPFINKSTSLKFTYFFQSCWFIQKWI